MCFQCLPHRIVKDDCKEVWGKSVPRQYTRCDFKPAVCFSIWRRDKCLSVLIHLSNCVHKFLRYAVCLEDTQHCTTIPAVESLKSDLTPSISLRRISGRLFDLPGLKPFWFGRRCWPKTGWILFSTRRLVSLAMMALSEIPR